VLAPDSVTAGTFTALVRVAARAPGSTGTFVVLDASGSTNTAPLPLAPSGNPEDG
jgi:hypothetical protein